MLYWAFDEHRTMICILLYVIYYDIICIILVYVATTMRRFPRSSGFDVNTRGLQDTVWRVVRRRYYIIARRVRTDQDKLYYILVFEKYSISIQCTIVYPNRRIDRITSRLQCPREYSELSEYYRNNVDTYTLTHRHMESS